MSADESRRKICSSVMPRDRRGSLVSYSGITAALDMRQHQADGGRDRKAEREMSEWKIKKGLCHNKEQISERRCYGETENI